MNRLHLNISVLLFAIVTFSISCSHGGNVRNTERNAHEIQYQLQFSKVTKVEIDHETSAFSMCIQYINIGGQSILVTLNSHDNSLRVFDSDSQNEVLPICRTEISLS